MNRNQLNITRELGSGNYGRVLLAEAEGIFKRGTITKVAVKTTKG